MTNREQKLHDMRQLLDWLADNPDVPLPDNYGKYHKAFLGLSDTHVYSFWSAVQLLGNAYRKVVRNDLQVTKGFGMVSYTLEIPLDAITTKKRVTTEIEVWDTEELCLTD